MARAGISYSDVAEVADRLLAQGVAQPSAKTIREELARRAAPGENVGSPNTIQRHLQTWRAQVKVRADAVTEVPAQLVTVLAESLKEAGAMASAETAQRLEALQTEQADLARLGEELEARLAAAQAELALRTSERDTLAGKLAANVDELDRRSAELLTAQRAVEDSRALVSAAEARAAGEQAKAEVLQSQLSQAQADLSRQQDASVRAAAAEASVTGLREQLQLLTDANALLRSLMKAAGHSLP